MRHGAITGEANRREAYVSDDVKLAERGESQQSIERRQLEQLRSYQAWASTELQSLAAKLRAAEARATVAEREFNALKQGKVFRLADLYWRARFRLRQLLGFRSPMAPIHKWTGSDELTAGPRFRSAVTQHLESSKGRAMYDVWMTYALTTNERGEGVLKRVQEQLGRDVRGLRILDIGCAYGGTCLAFARAGADAVGLEISPSLLELARANCEDHPNLSVRLLNRDATVPESLSDLGTFDIITCDNVIEHVLDVPGLLQRIAAVLNPEGLCHMAIPNGWSVDEVKRDGHFGQFGISLLPRERAEAFYHAVGFTGVYDVGYFFTLPQYEALFGAAGLSLTLLNTPVATSMALIERIAQDVDGLTMLFDKALADHRVPASMASEVQTALEAYQAGFREVYQRCLGIPLAKQLEQGSTIMRDYSLPLWLVISRPQPRAAR